MSRFDETSTIIAAQPGHDAVPETSVDQSMRRLRFAAIAIAVLGVFSALIVFGRSRPENPTTLTAAAVRKTASTVVADALKKEAAKPARARQIYQTILPSVVFIHVNGGDTSAPTTSTPADRESGEGLGTGVIIKADGSILTSLHVVDEADTIELTYADGTTSIASIASKDPDRDIAVLLPETLPDVVVVATMGGGVHVGDDIYAVGHPLGLVDSLSAGVVSGLDRSIPIDGRQLDGLIQFDAAVNPGNSGGPLLDRNANVVGIVTALANPSQQAFFGGIGFAVPIGAAAGGGDGEGAGPRV